jgi:hypothetical protein
MALNKLFFLLIIYFWSLILVHPPPQPIINHGCFEIFSSPPPPKNTFSPYHRLDFSPPAICLNLHLVDFFKDLCIFSLFYVKFPLYICSFFLTDLILFYVSFTYFSPHITSATITPIPHGRGGGALSLYKNITGTENLKR